MDNYNCQENHRWQELNPKIGDIVLCYFTDSFEYSVKTIVSEVEENNIVGVVEGVFDRNDGGMIQHHDLEGKQVTIPNNKIQKVVSR